MSPRARRILIPLIVAGLALGVVLVAVFTKRPVTTPPETETSQQTPGPSSPEEAVASDTDADAATVPTAEIGGASEEPAPGQSDTPLDLTGLAAIAPAGGVTGHDAPSESSGSLDPADDRMLVEFSRAGAGLARITFSDVWETAPARRQADAHRKALKAGRQPAVPLPPDTMRYVLQTIRPLRNQYRGSGIDVPALAANQVTVNGVTVNLFDYNRDPETDEKVYIWSETGPGQFETVLTTDAGEAILRITRRFILGQNYDITIEQRLKNLTDHPLDVRWSQYGPNSLHLDRSRYMDRRRFLFGYLPDPAQYPARNIVLADDGDLLFERSNMLKRWKKAEEAAARGDSEKQREMLELWPNKTSRENNYELSWFGATNRYFGLAVHPVLDDQGRGSRSLIDCVDSILLEASLPDGPQTTEQQKLVFTYLLSPIKTIEPRGELSLDLAAFAGPLDRHILNTEEPYASLAMYKLILYQMSSFCAFCTFQWLAHLLLGFLTLLHNYVVFDWGLAIIGLVLVVRGLLHPLTKKSQINMQRFGKTMQAMKPEMDKLRAKYPNDPKKVQQEQMRLMHEHGASPFQMLGCLPMFLQTPIWIALYAMLYFTFDLRQEPAFYGVFQLFGGWPFLGDLSAADHCLGEFSHPFRFLMWNVTGINVLPILMGVIFFFQQKYMSPPNPTMTKEQQQQQKIMKVLMVVLFPIMLYSAPSGLTLYILTSSCIGIIESKYVRAHIKEMDLNPPKKKERRKTKPKDAKGRAFAQSMDRMEEKRRRRKQGPEKKFKKKRK